MKALGDLLKLDFAIIPEGEERTPYLLALTAAIFFAFLLIGSAIYKFYDITTVYLDYKQTIAQIEKKPKYIPSTTSEPTTTVAFSDYPLFGTAPVTVNEATSNYALIGVQFSENHPDSGSVIIRANGSEDGVYRVGDSLPGGAVVNSISASEVIILNNGVAQRLTLSWEGEGGQLTTTAQAKTPNQEAQMQSDPRKGMVPRNKFFQNFPQQGGTMTEQLTPENLSSTLRYSFAKSQGVLIVEINEECVKAVYRPNASPGAIQELRRAMKKPVILSAVSEEEFATLLAKNYETKSGSASELAENISEKMDLKQLMVDLPKTADLLDSENDAPVISLLNVLFSEAIKQNASDIHLETFENRMSARFRVDGVLQPILELPPVLGPLVVSRIKVMSRLNIAEKRLPQDGRISIKIASNPIDVRVSTIPASHGERVVLRILNKKAVHLKLSDLGMHDNLLGWVREMIAKPHGIILVTGPTGAGKTTTLYAMLTELNQPGVNILTVEEPIEYDLPGIGQIQVNPKVEMTFARGLRAILRQDPNVIMVGEIRDLETATIAVQASLTGHLVLSTLHTNTAIGAITRLRDMGVEPFLLSSSLIGVISQRLVRLLCLDCKKPQKATKDQCAFLDIKEEDAPTIYNAVGCSQCGQSGYAGRRGVYEVMMMDPELKLKIHNHTNEQEIEVYLREKFPSIRDDGVKMILEGNTTVEEVIRVTTL